MSHLEDQLQPCAGLLDKTSKILRHTYTIYGCCYDSRRRSCREKMEKGEKFLFHSRALSSADVVIATHDGSLGTHPLCPLEQSIHHALSTLDVLLVIGGVETQSFPFVLLGASLDFASDTTLSMCSSCTL